VNERVRCSIGERCCEEIRSARDEIPTISDHALEYPGFRYAQSGLRLLPNTRYWGGERT
jgi:hypothetical protein